MKTSIIVFIVGLLSVGAAIYVEVSNVGFASPFGFTHSTVLPDLSVDDITQIQIDKAGHSQLVFERTVDGWVQTKPFTYPVDPYSMRQFAVLASDLVVHGIIDPSKQESHVTASSLRLDPPEAVISFSLAGGDVTLRLGRRSIAGRAYLQVQGDSQTYIVNSDLHERVIDMHPQEWRDRTLFRNINVDVNRIEARLGENQLELKRDRRQWLMSKPVRTRVSREALESFLYDLSRIRIGGFILDEPSDLSKFGLVQPVATFVVETRVTGSETGTEVQEIRIGSRIGASSQDRFGLVVGRPVVVRIPAAVVAAMFPDAGNLVSRTASSIVPGDVKSISIRTSTDEFSFVRKLDDWVSPRFNLAEADRDLVEEFLKLLTQVKSPDVAFQEYPPELEVAVVTLFGYDARALDTIRIAREENTGRWALENGDNVLRIFPVDIQLHLTPQDYGLSDSRRHFIDE